MDGRPPRSPWAPLAIGQANALLRDGGYGLWLERSSAGAWQLVGAGAGVGYPLAEEPSWADLCRALVRLRRTRRRHDPVWIDRLTRFFEDEQAWPVADWTPLADSRIERITAGVDLSSEGVRRCLSPLVDAAGSMLFPAGALPDGDQPAAEDPPGDGADGEGADREGGAGSWRPVGELTGADDDRSVRVRTTTAPLDREQARDQVRRWSRLARAVDTDPVLRMHCATQPVPVALVDVRTESAVLTRLVEPSPPHPSYPGGTFVVGLGNLLRAWSDGTAGLLRQVIANRFERREDELASFLEHFVRPLLRAFRHSLDNHGIGLYSLDERGLGFELSPELQATGRIVITDFGGVCERPGNVRTRASAGVRALTGTLSALCAGFRRIPFEGGAYSASRVDAAVDGVVAEELRYLNVDTAELLSREPPLRRFVHTVPSSQDDVLKGILRSVQEHARSRRWDARVPQPTVVIDLELCGLVPWQRTLDAARAIAGPREGAPEGVLELARPGSLAVLPTYVEATWREFVRASGLDRKYPEVDWQAVHREFHRAFARPLGQLRTDRVNAGLARFVWDVRDAGGKVVFCADRRERAREISEGVLADAGVPEAVLLCAPDERGRPTSELKAERLRELGDIGVVAVFDDVAANRMAITKEFPGARSVAVEVPGLASERRPEEPTCDQAPVIASFETSPWSNRRSPGLSHTHSLEELQVGSLRNNRLANRWAVRISTAESMSIVDSIVADVDRSAARTARLARAKFGLDRPDSGEQDVLRALHHVFTRKQFLKGSRSNYQFADLVRDAETFVRRRRPVEVVLLGFPVKQCLNRLKASGPLPDLAELAALARLRELQQAASAVYPPGLHFNVLTDGRHFRPRPAAITDAYQRKLREYVDLVGISGCTTLEEIDTVARERLGPDLPAERAALTARYRAALGEALAGFDITDNPLRTLEAIHEHAMRTEAAPCGPVAGPDAVSGRTIGLFREILMSVVYSVALPAPADVDLLAWSSLVYADVYNVTDAGVSEQVRQARVGVLRKAWEMAMRYLVTLRVDEALGYDDMIPDRVRLTVSAARPGRCGFTYLGGSGLLPWQGTGAIDPRGKVAVDFAVSLFDQGFVPVYSPLLGPRQPWLMVPGQHVRTVESAAAQEPDGSLSRAVGLDPALVAQARLRRR